MYGTYLMGLQSGLEAGLVAALVIAFAFRSGRRAALSSVLLASAAAALLMLGFGSVLEYGPRELTPRAEGIFGGFLSIAAAGLVGWVVLRTRRPPFKATGTATAPATATASGVQGLRRGHGALATTAALAVSHEGLTAALFLWSSVRAASDGHGSDGPLTVLLLGITTAVLVVWAVWRLALRVDLSRSVRWIGAALLVLAAGMLSKGVGHLQRADFSDGVPAAAFDFSDAIPAESWYGALLRGVLGFEPAPTGFQITVWALYLVPALALFLSPVGFGRSVGGKESAADEKADSGGRAAREPGAEGSAVPSNGGGGDGACLDGERVRDRARGARDRAGRNGGGSGRGAQGVH
ncbi:FTR1 family protein [Streptomyces sp. NBC_00690]|uniref:FTR1 family protein n=1 Tax=Streptomyces sp. NBC_00690 TaxID=2975808 RepID=UPI002E2A2DAE|nr:FTR1 family protein [Streptomyces sp. NBC_00690]